MPNPHIVQRNQVLEHQLAQRRSRKPNDRNMPDGVDDLIIGDAAQQYKDLRDIERKLDYTMMRKRLDIQDSVNRNVKRHKTMRIWISNTADNQPWQAQGLDADAFDFNSGEDGTYRVKIEGKLLDDDNDETKLLDESDEEDTEMGDGEERPKSRGTQIKLPRKRFSHFFKTISVEFDKARGMVPETVPQIEWKKQPGAADFDTLEFERKGDENQNVTINLFRDEQPERFRLSQALAQTLDAEEADRAEVVMGIWEYVKTMGLQEDEEKRSVRCDERLRQVFGADIVYFPQIPERIMPHLHPLPPVKLPYTIRVDSEHQDNTEATVYDIRVATEDPIRLKVLAMSQNPEYHAALKQITQLDDQLAILVQAIQHSKAKHTFYKSMSKDPVNFIKRWMSSQKRDLEVIMGDATRGGGEDGSGPEFARGGRDGVWGTPVVQEAVRYMLAKNAPVHA